MTVEQLYKIVKELPCGMEVGVFINDQFFAIKNVKQVDVMIGNKTRRSLLIDWNESDRLNFIPVKQCKRCQVELVRGQALQNTIVGFPDFIGDTGRERGSTQSASGPPIMVDCWKCPNCGYSTT